MKSLPLVPTGSNLPARPAELLLSEPRPPQACPVTVYLANDLTTKVSRTGARSHLRKVADILSLGRTDDPRLVDWPQLRQAEVARVQNLLLEQGAAPSSVNTIIAAVKGVLKQAWRLGLMSGEDYLRAVDVKRARGGRVDRKGRCLTVGEIAALMDACCDDDPPAGIRDAAIFALAFGAGLRRAELANLQFADYTPPAEPDGAATLVVSGKGNKERKVFITNGARDALADWLELRGDLAGPLFLPINKAGTIVLTGSAQSGQALAKMMARRATAAGVGEFSPHDCRRTYISGLLDHGVDISTAARLAGHASVETTRVYDRRGERAAMAAADTVHVPYRRPS
jgi:integrase